MALHVRTLRVPVGGGVLWVDLQLGLAGPSLRVSRQYDEVRQRERFVAVLGLVLPTVLVVIPAGAGLSVADRDAIERALKEVLT